jgi:hypothetical protein
MVFPTSQAPKVIHDLAVKGYISRVGRGSYRLTEPGDFVRNISGKEQDDRVLDEIEMDYALCESTAVAIWTDGYYWTGFTRGFRPVHVAVNERDLDGWKAFFKRKRVRFAVEGDSKTLFGKVYVLHPRKPVLITTLFRQSTEVLFRPIEAGLGGYLSKGFEGFGGLLSRKTDR